MSLWGVDLINSCVLPGASLVVRVTSYWDLSFLASWKCCFIGAGCLAADGGIAAAFCAHDFGGSFIRMLTIRSIFLSRALRSFSLNAIVGSASFAFSAWFVGVGSCFNLSIISSRSAAMSALVFAEREGFQSMVIAASAFLMSSSLFEVSVLWPDILVAAFLEAGIFTAAPTVKRRLLFACAVFIAGLAAFPRVVMPSLVFRAMLEGVSGTMGHSPVVGISVSLGCLAMLDNSVVSFFFGAMGTSMGVLYFFGGVLTVIESLLKAALPSSSSSLHCLAVLVVIIRLALASVILRSDATDDDD